MTNFKKVNKSKSKAVQGRHTGSRHSRYAALALVLCLTLMPVSAFAESQSAAGNSETSSAYSKAMTGTADAEPSAGSAAESSDSSIDSGVSGLTDSGSQDAAAGSSGTARSGADTNADSSAGTGSTENAADTSGTTDTSAVPDGDGEQAAAGDTNTDPAAEAETEEPSEQVVPKTVHPKNKAFKVGGVSVKFKSDVIADEFLPAAAAPARTWITANKTSIKVNWSKASDVDGYILLRKASKETTYTQVASLKAGTSSYTDKKAKTKNKTYYYIAVGYRKTDGGLQISTLSRWSAGQTTKSKLTNAYKATLSKTSVDLQSAQSQTITMKFAKPKKTILARNIRWLTSDASVAAVDSSGKVTGRAPGSATITGIMPSGRELKCTVSVVGAYTPAVPKIQLESADVDHIEISWAKSRNATSYDVYAAQGSTPPEKSTTNLIGNTMSLSYDHKGLEKNSEYTYLVVARNDNNGYSKESGNSNTLTQQAVFTPHKTAITGFPEKASPRAKTTYKATIKVKAPLKRVAELQLKDGKSWTTRKKITLPEGAAEKSVTIEFPDTWWKKSSETYRLVIPASSTATACTSGSIVITPTRYYQNPKGYVQITNKISKHGYSYYTSPVLVNNLSTRKDHVEAMIKTAYKYKGDPYANRWSRAPGSGGVDCSGLVMQACYGAGVDLWPSNPHRHRYGAAKYEWESREIAKMKTLKTVSYKNRKRGDLIFFANSKGTVIHVAIYLGNDKIIHSTTVGGHVVVTGMGGGAYGHVCKVKRVFVS